jgi:hypothetical protein
MKKGEKIRKWVGASSHHKLFYCDFEFRYVDGAFGADADTAAAACAEAFLAVVFCDSLAVCFYDFKSVFGAFFYAFFAVDAFFHRDFEDYTYFFENSKPA